MMEGEYAEQIVQSVRLLNHSVTNVLQFGKPIVPMPARLPLNQLLEGIRAFLQPIAQQKRIRIEIECGPDCFAVADYELLHRMLLNLVLNAMRELPADGIVILKGCAAKDGVVIEVEDTGPGIREDRVARIFDPMFSAGREGSGLGLPIVKRIVESHHGTIRVITDGVTGTRFSISIPHNTEVVREPLTCCR
jgi:signal transduction histidine kinase